MRILVVDDDPAKVAVLTEYLAARDIPASDVLVAEHASGARIILDHELIDILLIDVLLPARKGSLPQGEVSIELLRQIVDDGTTRAPRYIVGVTASLATRASFERDFESLFSQILHVAPGEHEWRESLNALLSLLQRVEGGASAYGTDICVLNALRVPELDAVLSSWPLSLGAEKLLCRNIAYRTGTVDLKGTPRRIVCAHLSQMGPIASSHAATALLTEFRPRVLLMTGICGGFAEQVNLGDVLVAEKSWDWQSGKWTGGVTLATASDQRDAAPELVADARAIEPTLSVFHSNYVGLKPSAVPRLVVGPMVTGSSVVASTDIQQIFRQQHRKMAGVDMECYGLYFAAENHAGPPVHAICIKAVSDLADREKADDLQRYCSQLSAMVSLDMMQRYFSRDA